MSKFLKKVSAVNFAVNFFDLKKQAIRYSTGIYTGGIKMQEWSSKSVDERNAALKKEWFVWWSFRHPTTGKLQRQSNSIKGGANFYKTKKERMQILKMYQKSLIKLLDDGYNPYDAEQESDDFTHIVRNKELRTIKSAFEAALKIKEKEVGAKTLRDYRSSSSRFQDYLEKKETIYIRDLKKEHVSGFLSSFNPRTSNNNKSNLGAIFSVLSDQGLVKTNFVKELRNKRVVKKPKKIYTEKDIIKITELLKEQDKDLLMYIKLESIMFWRPVELVRITIDCIDFSKKIMTADTKVKDGKIKIIPDILVDSLREFCLNKKHFLFHPKGRDYWETEDDYKRGYYTKKFKKFRERNNIDPDLKMYSFRHTYITTLYLELRKQMGIVESKKHLSLITGHESKAIESYIMVNDLELPDDYSHLYKCSALFKD